VTRVTDLMHVVARERRAKNRGEQTIEAAKEDAREHGRGPSVRSV
jgi:hypothetical protein